MNLHCSENDSKREDNWEAMTYLLPFKHMIPYRSATKVHMKIRVTAFNAHQAIAVNAQNRYQRSHIIVNNLIRLQRPLSVKNGKLPYLSFEAHHMRKINLHVMVFGVKTLVINVVGIPPCIAVVRACNLV